MITMVLHAAQLAADVTDQWLFPWLLNEMRHQLRHAATPRPPKDKPKWRVRGRKRYFTPDTW